MTQEEFDELDAIVVHLYEDDRMTTICSGERVDPNRWADSKKMRKLCQACYQESMRRMNADALPR